MKAYILMLIWTSQIVHALDWGSVTSSRMEAYMQQCPINLPTQTQMISEVENLMQQRRLTTTTITPFYVPNVSRSSVSIRPTSIRRVSLHGLILNDINPVDLQILERLTADSSQNAYRSRTLADGTLERTINSAAEVNLRRFNLPGVIPCSNALCVLQRIFGRGAGTSILWTYLKYNTSISPLSGEGGNTVLDPESFRALIYALEAIPPQLRNRAFSDSNGYLFNFFVISNPNWSDPYVIANMSGAISNDNFLRMPVSERAATFFHEMCHRLMSNEYMGIWNEATGWRVSPSDGSRVIEHPTSGFPSEYAMANHYEDFAETCMAYRFSPSSLKRVSPSRYNFMREKVFNHTEFDSSQTQCPNQSSRLIEPVPRTPFVNTREAY